MATSRLASNASTLNMIHILIVEDEYILARNMREGLESFGYQVLGIVDSGEAAIEKATELCPNIILMDIRIRGKIDGIQAAEQIWQQLQIPVIYVTGHSDQSTVERATLTSPFGYVLKPVREKELYVAIQTALSRYEREQFFSTVLREMGDGVIVVDPQLRIKYLNSTAEVLTGWKLAEVKEQLVTETIPLLNENEQNEITHPLISALEAATTIYVKSNVLLVRKDGTTLPITDSAALLRDNHGAVTGAVMVFRDDTQRRLAEERDRANDRAQQIAIQLEDQRRLNQLKDDFLATTSHELRTPLSNIKLAICLLETILNQQGILSSEGMAQSQVINRYLSVLRDQSEQELKLVNDLLDMRSVEAGAYPLDPTPIRLQDWLPHVVEAFQERVTAQEQALHINIPPDLPLLVSDLPSLTRIISELLNNACKYTPTAGQIVVEVAVEQEIGDREDREANATASVVISIKNSGVEISQEYLSQIFEPFYRIPKSDPWKHGGTGLGLALVKKLVEHLQGTIAVISEQNWTTFTLQLPFSLPLSKGIQE